MAGDGEELRVDVEGRTLVIKNLAKVLYPQTGTTKGEVLDYYARIAPTMLMHLRDRAVTRIRWPHGVQGMSFFEKTLCCAIALFQRRRVLRDHLYLSLQTLQF